MSARHPELLIASIALVSLCLAPLASQLVARIGDLNEHHSTVEGGVDRDDEIRQMIEATAFVRGVPVEEIEAELRDAGVISPSPADRRGPR